MVTPNDDDDRLVDRLRHAIVFLEAALRTVEEALQLAEQSLGRKP
jgi:hypothetical protein